MEPLTELELELISNKVLGRSKNLLATVRETLRERMITMENDTRTRLWSHPAADLGLLFDARHGILIGPEESMPVGKFSGCQKMYLPSVYKVISTKNALLLRATHENALCLNNTLHPVPKPNNSLAEYVRRY